MAEKEEQVKPLAPTAAVHPASSLDEESAGRWRSSQYLRKRRGVLFCCGCCGVAVVVLGFVALVLALTVFKVKDPVLTMNSIHVDGVHFGLGTPDHPASFNATLTADVSIKNPNVASFKFRNSTTEFYYSGQTVGVAYVPGSMVSADRTVRVNVTVDVMADRVARLKNMTDDIIGGSLNMTSYTEISGKVNLFGVFRRELDLFLNCSMTIELSLPDQDVKNKDCRVITR